MKTSFGLRFVGVSVMSYGKAIALTLYQATIPEYLNDYDSQFIYHSSWLAFYLITIGYYKCLKTPLKTRASLTSYTLYILVGLLLASLCIFKSLEILFSALSLNWTAILWTFILPIAIAYLPPILIYQFEKLKENPNFREWFYEGQGGSARWGSVGTISTIKGKLKQNFFTYWWDKKGVRTDGIFLGRALFSDDPFRRHIVVKDDSHVISMGLTGSGKTVSVQNFTYSLYEGSIIGFDPKGELSLATANRRNHENISRISKTTKHFPNGKVYIADPFGLNSRHGLKSIHYNPLAEVKKDFSNLRAIAADISDSCILREESSNIHFEDNARNIFEGYIIHVVTSYPKNCHTLPFVYDLISGINPETGFLDMEYQQKVLLAMAKNRACGGLAAETARILIEMGVNERGSMQTTVSRHLKWIGDENMRNHLSKSDFSFQNYGSKKTTINDKEEDLIETLYIVLPDSKIDGYMRYVRLILTMSIRMIQSREQKPKIPTLIIIDEFPRLGGGIEIIANGFGIFRSYGIKLWCFIQNLGQLKNDYPKLWSSMIGNSTLQAFGAGMGDNDTSEFISKSLGSRMIRRYDRKKTVLGFSKRVIISETARELLTPAEVTNKLGKSSNKQVILPNSGFPMRLERLAFKPLKIDNRKFRSLGLGGLSNQIED